VSVVLRHNCKLELNRIEYSGAVSLAEINALAEFQSAHPTMLTHDCLSIVSPGADFPNLDFAHLDGLFDRYRTMFAPLKFSIVRRSAWMCQSDAAREHVLHWLRGRNTREGMSSDVRLFETFADAGEWLILSEPEIASLSSGEGFREIVRYEIAPGVARAAR
jgi:hypothetical protein